MEGICLDGFLEEICSCWKENLGNPVGRGLGILGQNGGVNRPTMSIVGARSFLVTSLAEGKGCWGGGA